MKVVRAEHAGVCYGVERALDMVRDAMDGDEDVFTIGPLIHNPRVVTQLKDHGVESIEGPADVDHGIVVLRTHGVEPSGTSAACRASTPPALMCRAPRRPPPISPRRE